MMTVDLTEATGALLDLVMSGVVLGLGYALRHYFGAAVAVRATDILWDVADRGLDFAMARIAGPDGQVTAAMRGEVVARAASYVADNAPTVLRGMVKDTRSLEQRLDAQLAQKLAADPARVADEIPAGPRPIK